MKTVLPFSCPQLEVEKVSQQAVHAPSVPPPRPSRSITSETKSWATSLNEPLKTTDPDLHAIIEQEKVRQRESLVLIASENFTSR